MPGLRGRGWRDRRGDVDSLKGKSGMAECGEVVAIMVVESPLENQSRRAQKRVERR